MPPQAPATGLRDASWDDVISAVAKQHRVNPLLAIAVAEKESSKQQIDPATNQPVSGDGGQAIGMFQLHVPAAADMGLSAEDRADPLKNITGGVKYLKTLNQRYGGDVAKTLMAYNGGMDGVDKGSVSPQAQAYAAEVIANLSANMRETAAAGAGAGAAGGEQGFQSWYRNMATKHGLSPNPDDPAQMYDYRAAFKAGAQPDASGHWPSDFKRAGHPNEIVGGFNTRTEQRVAGTPRAKDAAELVKLGWDPKKAAKLVATPEPGATKPIVGYNQFGQTVGDFTAGVQARLAQVIHGGGDLIRRGAQAVGLPVERTITDPVNQAAMTAPASTAGQAGQFAAEIAEFAIPATKITQIAKGAKAAVLLVKAGINSQRAVKVGVAVAEGTAQAAAAAGITTLHGEDPTAAAVIAGAMPVAAQFVTSMAPAIRRGAVRRLSSFLERGTKGDITEKVERDLRQAASDMIDLPLERTWRQMYRMTHGRRAAAGEAQAAAKAGVLGDTPIPIKPIINGLNDMVAEVTHLLPAGKGQVRGHVPVPGLVTAVKELTDELAVYDDAFEGMPPARYIHDFKQIWQKAIYPRTDKAQPITETGEVLTTIGKEARMRGMQAIMTVLDQDLPQMAALDKAASHAIILDQFVRRIAAQARRGTLLKPSIRYAMQAVGGGVGVGVGGMSGHPIIGGHLGYATARLLTGAITSPKWRLTPIVMRRRLADAIASGNASVVRQIVTPIALAATATEDAILNTGAPPTP